MNDATTSAEATESTTTTQRPRILIVIGTLAIGGGAEKVAATVGSELTALGFEVHLLTFYEAAQNYPYHGIYHSAGESVLTSRWRKLWRVPQRIRTIQHYAKEHDIDLAISFLEEANFYTLLAKLFGAWKLPVIVSVRNNISRRSWPFKLATRVLYPWAAKVVSVTRAVEETLRSSYGLKNTTTIYNPLDMDMIDAKKQQPLPEEYARYFEQSPVCISIGRLIPQKGQWHLLRAFTKVREMHPQARLVILGDGELRADLEELRDHCGLQEAVYFLGKHENVYQFLAAADLFVFSSLWEGMPNTLLEGLAVGLPIVSPDCVSGPREILAPSLSVTKPLNYPYVTKSGILTEPQNDVVIWQAPHVVQLLPTEEALASAISEALTTQAAQGWQVPATAREPFRLKNIVTEWQLLIEQVAKGQPKG